MFKPLTPTACQCGCARGDAGAFLPSEPGVSTQCPQFGFLGPPPELGPGILQSSVLQTNGPVKELLHFPNSVLCPPNPGECSRPRTKQV